LAEGSALCDDDVIELNATPTIANKTPPPFAQVNDSKRKNIPSKKTHTTLEL
jgi:hypothetical protein